MKSPHAALGALPIALMLCVGCSDGVIDGYMPIGTGSSSPTAGSASGVIATGGSGGGNAPIAGTPAGTAGSTSGGTFNPTGGTGAGGTIAQGGSSLGGGEGGGAGGGGAVPTDGKGLYDANCKLCHGEQGVGSPLAYAIQHPVRDYSTWVTRNGRAVTTFAKPMEKWGTDKLSDAQLNLIWDYLDQPPQPTTGQGLYNDYCANCHGTNGTGGPTMRNIVNEVDNVLRLVRSGKNIGQYQMRHDSMPAFSTMRISDSELNLIHDYVDSF